MANNLKLRIYIGCDVTELSENAKDDLEGLDASAAHVASLLSTEPANSKLSPGAQMN